MQNHVAAGLFHSNLPKWDSFEAIFFVVAGFFIGLVLGILFPSLWRTFRRSFRRESKYSPHSENWNDTLNLNIKILPSDDEDAPENGDSVLYLPVFKAFTSARYFFQVGDSRRAIALYIEILTSVQISKQDTNRALFELSQVYSSIGLHSRAFDTAFELLNRKPHKNAVLTHLLKLCSQFFDANKLNMVISVYKGLPDAPLRCCLSHSLCEIADVYLQKNELTKAIDYSRMAVKWDRTSGRALISLWETTSRQFWEKNRSNKKMVWLSFATDLDARMQILINSPISAAAGANYLASLIETLFALPESESCFRDVENEFKSTFDWQKFSFVEQNLLGESLFYALVILQRSGALVRFREQHNFIEILSAILNQQIEKILKFIEYQKNHESYLFLGVLAHQCQKCRTFFPEFSWQCTHCGLEESLFPVMREPKELI